MRGGHGLLLGLTWAAQVLLLIDGSRPAYARRPEAANAPLAARQIRSEPARYAITGTELFAEVSTHERVPGMVLGTKRMGRRMIQEARLMESHTNLPVYEHWPFDDVSLKLEVRRAAPNCLYPAIDKTFLRGLGFVLMAVASLEQDVDSVVTGVISGPGDVSVFAFRLFYVPYHVGQGEKQAGVDFDADDLRNVQAVKEAIIANTTDTDLLLFIGNTASYFYHAFSAADDRNVHLIPLSGRCYLGGAPSRAAETSYSQTILAPAFASKRHGRVVLIDHVRKGDSIDHFIGLLRALNLLATPPSVIRLAYAGALAEDQPRASSSFQIWLDPVVVGHAYQDLERLDLGHVGRILPYYPREVWETDWHLVPNPDRPYADAIVRAIKASRIGA